MNSAALEQDQRARHEALNVHRSMILQAPAGSGKTTVLTARYLALLAAVDQPEEILAITFTRKSAAEMRQRVLKALQSASRNQQVAGIDSALLRSAAARNRDRGWDILRNPSRLRIDTIDALNYWLASQLPIAARASPGIRIATDAALLYRRAARQCLALANTEPAIGQALELVFERLDNNWKTVEDRLTEMLQERSHWLSRVVGASGDELVERVEEGLASTLRSALAKAMSVLSSDLLRECEQLLEHSLGTRQIAVPPSGVRLTADPACVPWWRALQGLLFTGSDTWRKSLTIKDGFEGADRAMKQRALALIEDLSARETRAALLPLAHLPDPHYTPEDRAALAALATLLLRAIVELQQVFAAAGQVDFSYISGAARQALTEQSEPTDLALRAGAALRHILVDEFQDTSLEQLQLLRALSVSWEQQDGRTLFVVGDPMQSIYQFREAEVGLFLQARDHGVGEVSLEPLQLRQNFRSRAPVIDWINDHFGLLFPSSDDARLAAIRYLPSVAGLPNSPDDTQAVTLHAFNADDLGAEAQQVVRIVRAARARNPAASIAVLVAARPHAVRLVSALSLSEFAVHGVDLQPLNERAAVRDLSALARCLLHGGDRSAWLALLRSPWCGLTLSELQGLNLQQQGDLFSVLRSQPDVSVPAKRVQRLCAALEPAMTGSERGIPLWQRADRCWLRLGGPSVYTREVDRLDARRFLDALAQHDDPDLLVGEGMGEITRRLYSGSTPQPGAIDVMTMHAAKGLEWDIVILPGLGRTTRGTSDRLMHWIELTRASSGADLLLAPIRATDVEPRASLAGYIKLLRRERSKLERVRLLYVAATRARQQLHLMGALKLPTTDRPPAPPANSLLSVLWPAISTRFLERFALIEAPQTSVQAGTSAPLRRLPADFQLPRAPQLATLARLSLTSNAVSDAPEYSWVGLTARAIGTVVHAELRRLADDTFQLTASEPDYRAWLSELGVAAGELPAAMAQIRAALKLTLADQRGRWLLSGNHRQAQSEWRLTGLYDGRIVNVIFDRMLVDADGQRWIVDYKTSNHEGGAIELFIDSEAQRYLPQMRRYATLAAKIDGAPVRAALYFPLLGIFRELTLA